MDDPRSERPWKTLETKYLIRKPWLTARVDKLELPDGRIMPEYYVLEYPDWVNVLALTTDGQMVMIRQYRYGLGQAGFELVAGVIDEGETPEQAARRELLEETGFGGGEWQEVMTLSANPSTTNNLTHCFLATGVERISTQQLEPPEDIEVHIMHPDEVLGMLQRNEIKQALMAAPMWKYFAKDNF